MNVLKNRTIDDVIVLGSGMSILDLTREEVDYINKCKVVIAVNKFVAFHKQTGIIPTHIYYTDDYYPASILFFNYMLRIVMKNKLEGVQLFTSENFYKQTIILTNSVFNLYALFTNRYLYQNIKNSLLLILNKSKIIRKIFKFKIDDRVHLFKINFLPKNSLKYNIKIVEYLSEFAPWSNSLFEPLYHFKGSLSTIFNLISILYPQRRIFLVGVDLNSSDYFFENELNNLKFNTRDWTYDLRKKENKHYSIIKTDGKVFDDGIYYMLDNLKKSGNEVFSNNKNSYLVQKEYIQYKRFI